MKTIYETKGAAKEYCDYAVDIYENCPHSCSYCYAKKKIENKNRKFSFNGVRKGVLEETRNYLKEHNELLGKMVFLGFSSDPFPTVEDCSATIEMAKLLKEYGCKVMVCTKGKLTEKVKEALLVVDSVGISLTCGNEMASKYEENAATPLERMEIIRYAKSIGKETWISFEPVLEPSFVYEVLNSDFMNFVDTAKFGKLNHMELSDLTGNKEDFIDWKEYLKMVESICKERNINYFIKFALESFRE